MSTANADNIRVFQCFRAGGHITMHGQNTYWDEADLERICRNYIYQEEAPLVIGHPPENGPAYGNVKELFQKKGVLYAVARCSQALLNLVRSGRYKYVSASFSEAPGPLSGWKLRHIGFLGATPPAVKGLAPLQFREVQNGMLPGAPDAVCSASRMALGASFAEVGGTFRTPRGWQVDPASMHLYSVARTVQAGCLCMSFSEAVSFAERLIHH